MQLPLMTSAVLAMLPAPHPPAVTASQAAPPRVAHTHLAVLPPTGPCPAYLGPQCDSAQHEQYVTGQDIAALGLGG